MTPADWVRLALEIAAFSTGYVVGAVVEHRIERRRQARKAAYCGVCGGPCSNCDDGVVTAFYPDGRVQQSTCHCRMEPVFRFIDGRWRPR